MVKNPPATQDTRVQSLSRKDPLEEEMATHSSALAWRIPGTEEPGGLQSMESQKRYGVATKQLNNSFSIVFPFSGLAQAFSKTRDDKIRIFLTRVLLVPEARV